MNQIVRQGDVLLVPVTRIPEAKQIQVEDERIILAHGEVTGHAHAIYESQKAKLWDAGAERYLQVLENTSLQHEEHSAAQLNTGNYLVCIQTEYTPQELRRVAD